MQPIDPTLVTTILRASRRYSLVSCCQNLAIMALTKAGGGVMARSGTEKMGVR
uniref:Uncharacterized protein n=1 Tax=Arundo donax TaxID=35708 RepID=A0A0A8ZGX3_ARUDO